MGGTFCIFQAPSSLLQTESGLLKCMESKSAILWDDHRLPSEFEGTLSLPTSTSGCSSYDLVIDPLASLPKQSGCLGGSKRGLCASFFCLYYRISKTIQSPQICSNVDLQTHTHIQILHTLSWSYDVHSCPVHPASRSAHRGVHSIFKN